MKTRTRYLIADAISLPLVWLWHSGLVALVAFVGFWIFDNFESALVVAGFYFGGALFGLILGLLLGYLERVFRARSLAALSRRRAGQPSSTSI